MDNIARSGLRYVKDRARRHDTVGQTTYRALELVSDGLDIAGRALRQLGEATQPPSRPTKELTGSKKAAASRPAAGKPRAKGA